MSGMSFSLIGSVKPAEILMLRIRNPQLRTSVDALGRVVRVTQTSDGTCMAFVRFEKKLALDQISPLRLQIAEEAVE